RSCASANMGREGKGLFELLDADGDGRLSLREMRNAVRLIEELDRDGDGLVSRTEIPRCSTLTFRLGPAAEGRSYPRTPYLRLTLDGDSVRGRQDTDPGKGPAWFRKMDRNRDGDVSRREFLGTDAQFRAIDTDGDGLISLAEAEAYDRKMREKKQDRP